MTEDLSLVVSSDDSNNIYTVNLDDYFRDNPDHLNVKDKTARTKAVTRGLPFSMEDEDQLVRNTRMADIACGDRFWKNELLEMRMEAANETSVTNGKAFMLVVLKQAWYLKIGIKISFCTLYLHLYFRRSIHLYNHPSIPPQLVYLSIHPTSLPPFIDRSILPFVHQSIHSFISSLIVH